MRKWVKGISMKQVHEQFGLYNGTWDKLMDRQRESDDGYSVSSRLLRTEWDKVEHVAIHKHAKDLTFGGKGDIPWRIKQEIKNELFGVERPAIEIFPAESHKVDDCDVYHLWVFEKGFRFPFGIHTKDENDFITVNRGYNFTADEAEKLKKTNGATKTS